MAQFDDPGMFYRLKAVPGIGDILALVILYEIGDLKTLPPRGRFSFVRSSGAWSTFICRKELRIAGAANKATLN